MFTAEEIDALALGARWVAGNADAALAQAAEDAMAKIAAVAPPDRGDFVDAPTLLAGGMGPVSPGDGLLLDIRQALRSERKLAIDYCDAKGDRSRRVVWPIALGFLRERRVVAAWCEARGDFRHFRVDRIEALKLLDARPPRRRRALLAEWRRAEGFEP
jgi:predicted DNA-binding transcriptional regulator YafY